MCVCVMVVLICANIRKRYDVNVFLSVIKRDVNFTESYHVALKLISLFLKHDSVAWVDLLHLTALGFIILSSLHDPHTNK